MDKQSAQPHSKFPHIPLKSKCKPDPGCNGCPLSLASGHESVAEFGPGEDASPEELFDAQWLAKAQWQINRRQLDADGIPGSHGDYWYPYNARGSFNYADFSIWKVDAVDGKQITLKTLDGSSAKQVTLYTWRERDKQAAVKWVNGFQRTGCVQPGDVIRISDNSKISHSCWPVVTDIVSCVGDTLIVECDKAATAALTKFQIKNPSTDEWEDDPNPVTANVYQHAGNPPEWRNIIKPDYFLGELKTKKISVSEVTEDGIYLLSNVPVMHPGGFGEKPTWLFEGRRRDNGEWEVVPQADQRLFLPDNRSFVCFKTAKPEEALENIELSADLTVDYNYFRLTYFEEASSGGCTFVGYKRCRHAVPCKSGGYNPSTGHDNGYACIKRTYDHHDIYDNYPVGDPDGYDDTAVHSIKEPTGISRFHQYCRQYGCCSHFEAAESGGGTAPFKMEDAGHALRELWGAANQRLERIIPRTPSFGAWQAQRVGHPSLMWHAGYVGIQTPTIIDNRDVIFRGYGLWANPYIWTDESDNQHIGTIQGGFDGFKNDDPLSDPAGQFSSISGWLNQRDPVNAANNGYIQRELERIGVAIEKDSGVLQPKGISQSSVATAPQNIIIPNLSKGDEEQHTANGSFIYKETEPSVLKIKPLRQPGKTPVILGSRKVHLVTSLGDGRYRIELENAAHTWSSIDDGPEIGDSYDKLITWNAGGAWPLMPKPHQQINSYYENNKYTGSRAAGAWRGDSIGVSVELGDIRQFIIDEVHPFGGSEAPNWGSTRHETFNYTIPGLWRPNKTNLALGTSPETYGEISLTSVRYYYSSVELTSVDDGDRPTPIDSGNYWSDATGIYFSPDDHSNWIAIEYDVLDADGEIKASYYEDYYVPSALGMSTMIPVGYYSSASSIIVEIDGDEATEGPDPGQYQVNLWGSYAIYTLNIADSDKPVAIRFAFDEPAPEPEDYYAIGGNYKSYGKKRDIVIVFDDTDYVANLNPGDSISFYTVSAVLMPGCTLEWTAYGSDNWTEVEDAEIRAGDGLFMIPPEFFDDKSRFCFRVKNAVWMDHRGIIPASVVNKTQQAIDSLEWVTTSMGNGGRSTGFGFYRYAMQDHIYIQNDYTGDPDDGDAMECIEEWRTFEPWVSSVFPPNGNYLYMQGSPVTGSAYHCVTDFSVSSGFIGIPNVFRFLPDDTEILEAKAEISAEGFVYYKKKTRRAQWDCDSESWVGGEDPEEHNEPEPGTLNYDIIGFTTENDFEVIGSIEGAAGGTQVKDITAVVKLMWEHRNTNPYPYGYGIIFSPLGLSPDTPLPLLGEGERAGILCNPPPDDEWGCKAATEEYVTDEVLTMDWDNLSIGNVVIRVKYSEAEKSRVIDWFRWPSQVDISSVHTP